MTRSTRFCVKRPRFAGEKTSGRTALLFACYDWSLGIRWRGSQLPDKQSFCHRGRRKHPACWRIIDSMKTTRRSTTAMPLSIQQPLIQVAVVITIFNLQTSGAYRTSICIEIISLTLCRLAHGSSPPICMHEPILRSSHTSRLCSRCKNSRI
jgi:hypothetical protein